MDEAKTANRGVNRPQGKQELDMNVQDKSARVQVESGSNQTSEYGLDNPPMDQPMGLRATDGGTRDGGDDNDDDDED
jgi:hypothetical protein